MAASETAQPTGRASLRPNGASAGASLNDRSSMTTAMWRANRPRQGRRVRGVRSLEPGQRRQRRDFRRAWPLDAADAAAPAHGPRRSDPARREGVGRGLILANNHPVARGEIMISDDKIAIT